MQDDLRGRRDASAGADPARLERSASTPPGECGPSPVRGGAAWADGSVGAAGPGAPNGHSTPRANGHPEAPAQGLQYPNWCFTVNKALDYAEQILADTVAKGLAKWCVYGREVAPTTGHRHLQGYIQFSKRQRFTQVCKILGGEVCHWEAAMGDAAANFKYCTKSGDFVEFGERPEFENAGQREKRRWDDAFNHARDGNYEEMDKQILVCHYKNLRGIHNDFRPPAEVANYHGENELKHRFRWYYGEPGSGKTSHAYRLAGALGLDVYVKSHNKWWCGYKKGTMVLLDDVNQDATWLGDFLKLWCQEYPFQAETKGGMSTIRPDYIIITSNYHPHAIFKDPAMRAALDRRIDVYFHGQDENYRYRDPGPDAPGFVRASRLPRPKTPGLVTPPPRLVRSDTLLLAPQKPVEVVDLTAGDESDDE